MCCCCVIFFHSFCHFTPYYTSRLFIFDAVNIAGLASWYKLYLGMGVGTGGGGHTCPPIILPSEMFLTQYALLSKKLAHKMFIFIKIFRLASLACEDTSN